MSGGPPERRGPTMLGVRIDGVALSDDDARAFWDRFSRYMEDHPRDLAGFAKSEDLASVVPQTGPNGALLVGSKSAPQAPYSNAKPAGGAQPSSGSSGHQRGAPNSSRARKSPKK